MIEGIVVVRRQLVDSQRMVLQYWKSLDTLLAQPLGQIAAQRFRNTQLA